MRIAELQEQGARILDEVERAVGKRERLEFVLLGLLADGHVLLEDFPGWRRHSQRSFATVTSLDFACIQFTPDLMPSDVTGLVDLEPARRHLRLPAGADLPTNLLLADEINRAPPKTQAALLEAMQERQVTIEGTTHLLARPFLVLATQNPIEYEGTYPLPEAQLDRFVLRTGFGYPAPRTSWRCSSGASSVARTTCSSNLSSTARRCSRWHAVEDVHVAPSIGRYIVELVGATRCAAVGSSPRGSLALLKLSAAGGARRARLRDA